MSIALEKQYSDLLIRINPSHTGESYYPVEAWVEDSAGTRQHFDGGHFYFIPDANQQIDPQTGWHSTMRYSLVQSCRLMIMHKYWQTSNQKEG